MRVRIVKVVVAVVAVAAGAVVVTASPAGAASATLVQFAPNPALYTAQAATFSVSGNVTAPARFVDVQVPPAPSPNSSTSGCESADFAGFPAGAIAIIQRGTCTFAVKAANAQAAGATAVVIFNEGQPGRTDIFPVSLGSPGVVTIPVVVTSFTNAEFMFLQQNGLVLQVTVSASAVASCGSPPASGTAVGGRNVVVAQPGVPTTGTEGADVIYGTSGQDRIDGFGGNDLIFGFGGNDQLMGGDGNDTVCGGDGHDFVAGGAGNDELSGDAGNDQLVGAAGVDNLVDATGWNALNGGDGEDFCTVTGASNSVQNCELSSS